MKDNNKLYNFSIEMIADFQDDEDPEFAYGNMVFLSTKPNSHRLDISEDVLRESSNSILGKWVVCKYNPYREDAEGHSPAEVIVGMIPKDQEVKFSYDEDGYLLAQVDFVLSKIYANDIYNVFKRDNFRNVSVEMMTNGTKNLESGGELVSRFNVCAVTILGKTVDGSCPSANAQLVKFEENKMSEFYKEHCVSELESLKKFAKERTIINMASTYKVNKSKDSLSDTPWGDVDKTALRNKIMDADNKSTLVRDVYMVVEDGWEDAPSEKLKYPVMQFKGDTLVYNRGGLSSALGYAKTEDDSAVVNKVNKIRKELDIDENNNEGKETKMQLSLKELATIEGRKAWGDVIRKVESHEGGGAYVDSVESDHIIYTKDDVRYRVNANVKVGEDDKTVDANIDWSTKKKDEVQKMEKDKNLDDPKKVKFDDDCDDDDWDGEKHLEKIKKFCDDFTKKFSSDANVDSSAYAEMLIQEAERNRRLADKYKDQNNIIMEKDKMIGELKKFKEDKDKETVEFTVATTMEEVREFIDAETFEKLQDEGKASKLEDITGWKNKVKSLAFEASKGKSNVQKLSGKTGVWRMDAPQSQVENKSSLWGN